ncbi:hypothetical protein [Hydrogenophaga sp.]|uniref:hypothetical protein n=1 Tax=Hydrogenophaga sp. TaxID=1904254 RepID=UPI002605741A|nr:hypothetical protein [Hydrogenophaga sp.]
MKSQTTFSRMALGTPMEGRQRAVAPAMPRNAGMDALVKRVHSSEAFSFETAAANVERAMKRAKAHA